MVLKYTINSVRLRSGNTSKPRAYFDGRFEQKLRENWKGYFELIWCHKTKTPYI